MTEFIVRSFDHPDEVMEYPKAELELVRVGGIEVWRMKAEAGWRYSEHMGPSEGTDTCQAEHVLWLMISGRLAVQAADGTTKEFGPGDLGSIPPGHEAWVVGDEPVVAFDVLPGGSAGEADAS
jgi:mannose-6-phosphate isomerase-like protein (cupin superfamily)